MFKRYRKWRRSRLAKRVLKEIASLKGFGFVNHDGTTYWFQAIAEDKRTEGEWSIAE